VVVRRGDIWLISLDPTVGSEIQKSRPCVIISPVEMNEYLKTVIVAPMTTGSKPSPFRIPVQHAGKEGLILLDQIRTVDKSRLMSNFGQVSPVTLKNTMLTLQDVFAL